MAAVCWKNSYPTRKEAQSALNGIMRGHRRKRPDFLRIYYCPRCGAHHLTKQSK